MSPTVKRSVIRSLRFTRAEEHAIAKEAKRAGLTWAVYAREAILARAAPEMSQASRTQRLTETDS